MRPVVRYPALLCAVWLIAGCAMIGDREPPLPLYMNGLLKDSDGRRFFRGMAEGRTTQKEAQDAALADAYKEVSSHIAVRVESAFKEATRAEMSEKQERYRTLVDASTSVWTKGVVRQARVEEREVVELRKGWRACVLISVPIESLDPSLEKAIDKLVHRLREVLAAADPEGPSRVIGLRALAAPGAQRDLAAILEDCLLSRMAQLLGQDEPSWSIVSRRYTDAVLAAQGEALSRMYDETTAPELGKLIAAQIVLMGSLLAGKDEVMMFVNCADVTSGKVFGGGSVRLHRSEVLNGELRAYGKGRLRQVADADIRDQYCSGEPAEEFILRGDRYYDHLKDEDALACYRRAADQDDGLTPAGRARVWSRIGYLLQEQAENAKKRGDAASAEKSMEEAENALRKALAADPNHLKANANLGRLYLARAATVDAAQADMHLATGERYLKTALRVDATCIAAHFNLARAHALRADVEGLAKSESRPDRDLAIGHYRSAFKHGLRDCRAEAHYDLGRLLFMNWHQDAATAREDAESAADLQARLGRLAPTAGEALKHLKAYLAEAPEGPYAAATKKMIDILTK